MHRVIVLLRASRMTVHLVCGLTIALFFPWFSAPLRRSILCRWSAKLLKILNVSIKIAAEGFPVKSGIIVSNHISWLDVFVLNAIVPVRFVAKSEVKSWPAIGWLCTRAQTLFIERGRARDAARLNSQVVELLQHGECLALFPEGTTTDGKTVGTFYASLLQPAVDAGTQVHPFAIRYQDAAGMHSTAAAYIDDLSFGASLSNILNCRNLHVHLVATPSLDGLGSDRRTLSNRAHQQISASIEIMHTAGRSLAVN